MERRGFLKLLGAGAGLAVTGGTLPAFGAPRRKPTMVVITDVTPDVPLQRFAAMLGTMLAQGLPVSCIVHTTAPNGEKLRPDSALAQLLRSFMASAPGVIEIIPHTKGIAGQDDWFQARTAFQARKELIEALLPDQSDAFAGPILQSIACDYVPEPLSPLGVRSAGIRNVLVLPKGSAPVKSEYWDEGVLRLTGGVRADLFAALEHLSKLSPQQFQNIILLSVRENMDKSEHVVKAAATVFANVALQHEQDQWISNMRLSDLQLRDGYFKFERKIGLHLYQPAANDTRQRDGFEAFAKMLTSEGLGFSTGPRPVNSAAMAAQQGYWIGTEAEPEQTAVSAQQTLIDLGCSTGPVLATPQPGVFLEAGVGMALNSRNGGVQGMDDCGHIHVPTVEISNDGSNRARILNGVSHTNDLILAVSPDLTVTPAQRNALRTELRGLRADYVTKIVSVADVVRPIVPTSDLISLYRHTEAYQPRIIPDRRPISEAEREALYEDAVSAWSYFYRFTNPNNGLCPATVFYASGQKFALNSATMWDIGSHLNALMAAVDIGLIEERPYRANIAKILKNIAGKKVNGIRLPSEWIKTNRNSSGNTNFDISDAGRLLAALSNLKKHRIKIDGIDELVASWSFDQIIVDRKAHSLIDGKLRDDFVSHSAHYVAMSFRRWGFDVKSPYEVFDTIPTCDDKMALLKAASEIGALGAEPLLMEALDYGLSPQSSYLSDVLYGAQMREFDTTGELVCVSEGPIDRSPWFTYQGLQFDAPDRTWLVDTVRDDPKYSEAEFQKEHRVTSSKSAFLWAATKPQAFSQALVDYVRKHGRTPVGFASSIYARGDLPTKNYTDINTNGVILQAIAHMLRDRETS